MFSFSCCSLQYRVFCQITLLVNTVTFSSRTFQEHKVLLTGTPLQNTVEELFSLLHFLEPARFPSENTFMQEFGDLKTEEQVTLWIHREYVLTFLHFVIIRDATVNIQYILDGRIKVSHDKFRQHSLRFWCHFWHLKVYSF